MNFAVSQAIQSFGNHLIFSPNLTSTPSQNYINPGINLSLYKGFVPINNASFSNKVNKKLIQEEFTENKAEQEGSGEMESNEIEKSFLHPVPIKTEMVELLTVKGSSKRKNITKDSKLSLKRKKKELIDHKFQFD